MTCSTAAGNVVSSGDASSLRLRSPIERCRTIAAGRSLVHHCGAGTSAAALRAGRPSVAVPFFADQPTWARALHELGTAPSPVPKSKLTAARLGAAITQAVSDRRHAVRAAALGEAIRAEQGTDRAADRIERALDARRETTLRATE